ncbi:hypothetical protein TNCV_1884151 [Trichonephila clavipes]|nr:hypothetical protein TNCV_1884151 [Trichonephila clavipes]
MKTFQILTKAYGDKSLYHAHVLEVRKWFSGGRDSVKDDEHAVRPRSAITDQNIAKIRNMTGFPLTSVRNRDLNGLSRKDKPCIVTPNINVADGLANAAVSKLSRVELGNQNRVLLVWLPFPNGVKVKARDVKARGKVDGYANAKGISREMAPINRRFTTVPLNRNTLIHAKRNNFPLKPAAS